MFHHAVSPRLSRALLLASAAPLGLFLMGISSCETSDADGDGWTTEDGDCDDHDAAAHPGADEICDGTDTDCDGSIPAVETTDSDEDGVVNCADVGALEFDGNDLVIINDSSTLHLTGAMTLEAWMKTTASTSSENAVVGKHTCGSATGWFMGLNSYYSAHDAAQYYLGEHATRITDTRSLNDGEWHHLAATFDGTTAILYVDGAAVGSASTSYTATNSLDITIGVHSATCGSGYFVGVIDEVSLWSVARSTDEIVGDMSGRLAGDENGLEAYWDFNEGTGETVTDLSGHGWVGTLGTSSSSDDNDPAWVADGRY